MSQRALALAARDQLQNLFNLTSDSCEVQEDGEPKPACGEQFISIHHGPWVPTPHGDYDLDETFTVFVTLSRRVGQVPLDRWGPALEDLANTGIQPMLRNIVQAIHKQYLVMNAANAVYLAGGPLAGFCEPLMFLDGGRPEIKGAEWFSAEDLQSSIEGNKFVNNCGIAQTITFGGARRVQQIFPTISISPSPLSLSPAKPIGSTVPLPNATHSVPYSETLSATGGDGSGTYAYTLAPLSTMVTWPAGAILNTLPSGLLLSSGGGVISGTPGSASAGTYIFRVQVQDPTGFQGFQNYQLTVT